MVESRLIGWSLAGHWMGCIYPEQGIPGQFSTLSADANVVAVGESSAKGVTSSEARPL